MHQFLARRVLPKVSLSKQQSALMEGLDGIALAVWRAWLIRGLDRDPLPPRAVLAHRLWEAGERLRSSLFAHAEAIALQGVLSHDQAERCRGALWESQGLRALLDPALADRLRLTRSQRRDLLSLLTEKDRVAQELADISISPQVMGLPDARRKELLGRLGQEARLRRDALDDTIWSEVLNPSQSRALERILNGGKRRGN
jgi:hypothetical protein